VAIEILAGVRAAEVDAMRMSASNPQLLAFGGRRHGVCGQRIVEARNARFFVSIRDRGLEIPDRPDFVGREFAAAIVERAFGLPQPPDRLAERARSGTDCSPRFGTDTRRLP
jgi:hypothetical protein